MFFLNKNDFSPTWIDLVSIIIREKVPPDYKKPQAVMQLPHDGKDLGIVGTLELAGWTLKQHGQFGESWWSLRFNPTWSSSFFYPRCQHDCFTELLNFKYSFKSCWSISGVNRTYHFKLSFILKLYGAAVPQSDLGKTWTPTARTTVLVFWKLLLQTPPLRGWPQFPYIGSFVIDTSRKMTWTCSTMVFWFHEVQWNPGEISWNKI